MEAMRDAWTDPRLDDLNHRVAPGAVELYRSFQLLMRTLLAGFGLMIVGFGMTIAALLTRV